MKFLLRFILLLALTGCIDNKVKLIEAFVCTEDGITSDLDFKMIKLIELPPITPVDSILYLIYDTIPSKYSWKGDSLYLSYPEKDGTSSEDTFVRSDIDVLLKFYDEGNERAIEQQKELLKMIEEFKKK